jgi:hypothetical protein
MANRIPTIRHGDIVLVTLTTADPFEGRAVMWDLRVHLKKLGIEAWVIIQAPAPVTTIQVLAHVEAANDGHGD